MKFDSKKAEHEYITTKTSYRALAQKYEVDLKYLAKYAKKNEWVKKREEYQQKSLQKSIEKTMDKEVDKLATCKSATDKAIARVDEMMADCKTPQDMRALASALKDLIGMQRDLHGITNEDKNTRHIVVDLQGGTEEWSK